jgi:hypothetical protein
VTAARSNIAVNDNYVLLDGGAGCKGIRLMSRVGQTVTNLTVDGNEVSRGASGTNDITIDAAFVTGLRIGRNICVNDKHINMSSGMGSQLRYSDRDRRSITTVGDAAATLYAGLSDGTQIWNTALTADRAVTLSTTEAAEGDKFRIVRNASATGAFNLNVGTGPLKAMGSASTWCEVEYDGAAWVLTAYGAL